MESEILSKAASSLPNERTNKQPAFFPVISDIMSLWNYGLLLCWEEDTARGIQVLLRFTLRTFIRLDNSPLPLSFDSALLEELVHECAQQTLQRKK